MCSRKTHTQSPNWNEHTKHHKTSLLCAVFQQRAPPHTLHSAIFHRFWVGGHRYLVGGLCSYVGGRCWLLGSFCFSTVTRLQPRHCWRLCQSAKTLHIFVVCSLRAAEKQSGLHTWAGQSAFERLDLLCCCSNLCPFLLLPKEYTPGLYVRVLASQAADLWHQQQILISKTKQLKHTIK